MLFPIPQKLFTVDGSTLAGYLVKLGAGGLAAVTVALEKGKLLLSRPTKRQASPDSSASIDTEALRDLEVLEEAERMIEAVVTESPGHECLIPLLPREFRRLHQAMIALGYRNEATEDDEIKLSTKVPVSFSYWCDDPDLLIALRAMWEVGQ